MASDYRELPERVAAAIAELIDAMGRAAPQAYRCPKCGYTQTLRVDAAEWAVLNAIRREYVRVKPKAA